MEPDPRALIRRGGGIPETSVKENIYEKRKSKTHARAVENSGRI